MPPPAPPSAAAPSREAPRPTAWAADRVFDGLGGEHADTAVVLDPATGRIEALVPAAQRPDAVRVEGALAPGFINAHGHLELSHLRGRLPEGTGLVPFLRAVTEERNADPAAIDAALQAAHQELLREGVAGMGDIANTDHTVALKRASPLRWHTFVEVFGVTAEGADRGLARGLPVLEAHRAAGLTAELSPHAPYSVHPALLRALAERAEGRLMSIHLQESPAEEAWFREGGGPFAGFFDAMGLAAEAPGPGPGPAGVVLDALLGGRLLLVHNTLAGPEDRARAVAHPDAWWCFCPRANRYIEGRLPDLPAWREHADRVVIGTDSLASNARLSIHAELAEIRAAFPELPDALLLRWACGNGAALFGWEAELGALAPGRSPGLLALGPSAEGPLFGPGASVRVLVPPGGERVRP
jgi:cytosine/adenosine deaminase-related metal-dependent hydrolase